jgi:hypothetical protein
MLLDIIDYCFGDLIPDYLKVDGMMIYQKKAQTVVASQRKLDELFLKLRAEAELHDKSRSS